jgi:arginase family enzyme
VPTAPKQRHHQRVSIKVASVVDAEAVRKVLDPRASIGGPVHVHFDLNVLDPREFPYVAYPDGRLAVDEAVDLLGGIARQTDMVGLTVTGFAPCDEDQAREGGRVIARLCEAAIDSSSADPRRDTGHFAADAVIQGALRSAQQPSLDWSG